MDPVAHLPHAAGVTLTAAQHVLTVLSGSAVGFTLGIIGGGGSILAVPLLLYLVGYPDPHVVIGTTAFAVSMNAYANLALHARAGNVRWRQGILFAVVGATMAFVGSSIGKAVDGRRLLFLFALLMLAIAVLMVRQRAMAAMLEKAKAQCSEGLCAARLAGSAALAGAFSGFFGIGGGFLIVPGLALPTGMPMVTAVGTSLISVGTFGLTTALNYARSGMLDWRVALQFIAGGIVGGWAGTRAATRLGRNGKGTLNWIFAGLVVAVASYMLYKNAP